MRVFKILTAGALALAALLVAGIGDGEQLARSGVPTCGVQSVMCERGGWLVTTDGVYPPCDSDGANGCWWDASTRGDGVGVSWYATAAGDVYRVVSA